MVDNGKKKIVKMHYEDLAPETPTPARMTRQRLRLMEVSITAALGKCGKNGTQGST